MFKKTLCCERGKNIVLGKGGGINIVLRLKYRLLGMPLVLIFRFLGF
jgi:hypothetical protein